MKKHLSHALLSSVALLGIGTADAKTRIIEVDVASAVIPGATQAGYFTSGETFILHNDKKGTLRLWWVEPRGGDSLVPAASIAIPLDSRTPLPRKQWPEIKGDPSCVSRAAVDQVVSSSLTTGRGPGDSAIFGVGTLDGPAVYDPSGLMKCDYGEADPSFYQASIYWVTRTGEQKRITRPGVRIARLYSSGGTPRALLRVLPESTVNPLWEVVDLSTGAVVRLEAEVGPGEWAPVGDELWWVRPGLKVQRFSADGTRNLGEFSTPASGDRVQDVQAGSSGIAVLTRKGTSDERFLTWVGPNGGSLGKSKQVSDHGGGLHRTRDGALYVLVHEADHREYTFQDAREGPSSALNLPLPPKGTASCWYDIEGDRAGPVLAVWCPTGSTDSAPARVKRFPLGNDAAKGERP